MDKTTSQERRENPWQGLVRFGDFLTAPHPSITEVGARRQARLVATLALILFMTLTIAIASSIMVNQAGLSPSVSIMGMLSAGCLVTYIFGRTKLFRIGAGVAILTLSAFSYGEVIMVDIDLFRAVLTTVPLAILFAIALLPVWGVLLVTMVNIAAIAGLPVVMPSVPGNEIWSTIGIVLAFGALATIVSASRNAIERDRLAEIRAGNQQLADISTGLEQRVADRTAAIALAAEVGRRVTQMQDTNQVLAEAVELILQQFDLYYVQVYLVNPLENSLVLKAGSGQVGQTLLSRSHNLFLDRSSINGTAVVNKEPVIVSDTAASPTFRPNPLLPETRSEMSIPLISGDRVLGVLDLQASVAGSLTQEDLPAYQVMAGQLATALANAELFSSLQGTLKELESRSGSTAQASWADYLDAIHEREHFGYVLENGELTALSEGSIEPAHPDNFVVPIQVAGKQIGLFNVGNPDELSDEDRELVGFVAFQAAQQLDNLHLISQATRYRDEAETALRQMTGGSWQEYLNSMERGQVGFVYDHELVKLVEPEQHDELPSVTFDMKVQENPIGRLEISGVDLLSPQDAALVQTVSDQLSAHLENMRLFNTAQRELDDRRRTEEALRVSQEQYTLAISGANDGIWDWNLITGEQYMAPRWKEQLGYGPDELENSFEEFNSRLHPDDADRVNMALHSYIGGESPSYQVECRLRHKDGSYRWILARGTALRDETGRPIRMAGSHMDITDRKELEETLRRDRIRLSEALDAAKMANWQFDLAKGNFIFADDMYRMLGTTAEAEGGYVMPAQVLIHKYIHPDDQESVGAVIQEGMMNPQQGLQREIAYRNIRTDGKVISVITRYTFMKTEDNEITASGATQDVTELVRQQELTAQRAAELATVAEVSTVITTIMDPEEMLQRVVDMTKERFDYYHAHIYMLDENSENLVLRAGASGVGRQMVKEGRSIALNTEKSLVARTARSRKGLIVNRVHEDPDFLSNPLLPDTKAEMAVPLLAGDQLLGVLDVQDDAVDRFTEENINVLTTLASQVAVSLQNARSYIRAQQQAERESLINAISERIQSTTSVESALQVAVRELGRALGAQRTVIQLGLQQQETTHNN